jgi:hypothetical protein
VAESQRLLFGSFLGWRSTAVLATSAVRDRTSVARLAEQKGAAAAAPRFALMRLYQ